ncbi:MAG: hypothetical protein A2Z04_08395 [Chloroflexi bacterium RBG_16_57_9]|nr:MAG: hypothetical protein A2Z04_08395 [Chloroflexi bacterium RBG_16_57_9]
MFRPEPLDLIIILIIALLFFGPRRLPEISRAIGTAIRDFRSAVSGQEEETRPPEKTGTQPSPAPSEETQTLFEQAPQEKPDGLE